MGFVSMLAASDIVIGVVDVGAPKNIGWAVLAGEREAHGSDLDDFIECYTHRSYGRAAALGFEAPLFIPFDRPTERVTQQRHGEAGRPWSAGAGATVTTVGLAVVSHVLVQLRERRPGRRAQLTWANWPNADHDPFFYLRRS